MNQILSVEMPKRSNKRIKGETKKASTKSVVLFFSIVLIIFGIALIGMGIYSITNNKQQKNDNNSIISKSSEIRIDTVQNGDELEIEISGESEISKIEYNWENEDITTIDGNGTNNVETSIKIPSGTNYFYLVATDINGNKNNYSKQYVGSQELQHVQLKEAEGNKIKIEFNQEQKISYISYFYDDEEEKKVETDGSNQAEIEIETKEGEHNLTLKVGFADGTFAQKRSKMFIPIVKVSTDGSNFIINATDKRNIVKAVINFNGVETTQEDLDNQIYEKTLPLQEGENRLIIKIYNAEGGKMMKRIKWEKK